jgi:hypothetical protein
MLNIVMLSVDINNIMPNVIMLSVVVPLFIAINLKNNLEIPLYFVKIGALLL